FLGLLDRDSAARTPAFERLSRVTTNEYPRAMAELVQNAYAPVLAVIDPEQANDVAVHDAFRGYNPAGQRSRMVGLFLALCRESGLVEGGPIEGQRAHVRSRGAGRAVVPARVRQQRPPAGAPREQPRPPADGNGVGHGDPGAPD